MIYQTYLNYKHYTCVRVQNLETSVGDEISASDNSLCFAHIFPSKLLMSSRIFQM